MNIEKYTDRARGFVQSAQSLALREGHQQFTPEHLLKVLLDDPEGLDDVGRDFTSDDTAVVRRRHRLVHLRRAQQRGSASAGANARSGALRTQRLVGLLGV